MRIAVCLTLLAAASAFAQGPPNFPSPQNLYSYEQKLGARLPLDARFVDEQGRSVRLGDHFTAGRPVVLVLVQYRCPMLCNQVLNGLVDCVAGLPEKAGKAFEVVVVSFDPREKPELARSKKASYVEAYNQPGGERGWHFLTGEQESIEALAMEVGFHYAYSPSVDRYAHPSGVVVITGAGRVSKYLYGISYSSGEMQEAIRMAASDEVGRPVPKFYQVVLLCYDFDPATGTYRFSVMSAVRLGGALTVLVLVGGLLTSWARERLAARRRTKGEAKHDA